MKAIALCLCLSLNASELRLTYDGATVAVNVAEPVEVYGTQDFSRWKLESRFTNSSPLRTTNRFFKARIVPPPASLSVVAVATNTLVFLSDTATAPIAQIVATAGSLSSTGFMTRQFLDPTRPIVRSCSWIVPPFNWNGGSISIRCVDINDNPVSTNVTPLQYFSAPIVVDYPNGTVIGDTVRVSGFCESDKALVYVDTGTGIYIATVRRGTFITSPIPVQPVNNWSVHYSLGDEISIPLAFNRSPISVNYSVSDYTFLYGERGIVLRGTISDAAYDLWIGTNFVSTTNGQWQIRIPPPGSMIRIKVQPKSSMVPFRAEAMNSFNLGDLVYSTSLIGSSTYRNPKENLCKVVLTEYRGYDKTNRITFRKVEGKQDCMLSYQGYGEWLDWFEESGDCGGQAFRTLFPRKYISSHEDCERNDSYADSTSSTCMLYIGGDAGEHFRAEIGIIIWPGYRMGNQLGFGDAYIPEDWKLGGNKMPMEMEVESGQFIDVTPAMPIMGQGFYTYDVTLRKELIP